MAQRILTLFVFLIVCFTSGAQQIRWSADGNSYYRIEQNEINQYTLPDRKKTVLVSKQQLTPAGKNEALKISHYSFSDDQKKVLLFTNTQRVWRLNTKGDYWVLDMTSGSLTQIGKNQPPSSMMFAKFSPDGTKVAYVSEYNVYVDDLSSNTTKALTTDGNRKMINGTFDWVYEEEFFCRDGIRWSPDSKSVAFFQVDARKTRDYYMVNFTDSVYSRIIPVEYPKVGEDPSSVRIGVVDVSSGKTTWLNIPGDPVQNYLVRAEYIPNTNDIIVQQLNRKQNESKLIRVNANGSATVIYSEKDPAWVEVNAVAGDNPYTVDYRHRIDWLGNGQEFLWSSEKDGWAHLYRISVDGKKQTLLTPGNFDVISLKRIDEKAGVVYYLASPTNATQKYLYRTKLDGKGKNELVTPAGLSGTHNYTISTNGKFAQHSFSNVQTTPASEWISLPAHKALNESESIQSKLANVKNANAPEFFKVKTVDGVEMDGWVVKPENFDPSKKYPIVFFVYTEPAGANAVDSYGAGNNFLYNGDMQKDGYVYVTVDNRGTPVPKGSAWRKSIYRKIGLVNIRDQAMAAKEILKWNYIDTTRVAVWGWSGGAAATLNLLFQYPQIYKTGIAVAAVANQLTYDNIYQERYMGLPRENMEDFIKGSPITYAKNLRGNLLYIHGTGDDNVHYSNAEMLLNELIKHNKQFQFMAYPNRTHGISEGEGTGEHLSTLYTNYLRQYCPPGGR